MTTDVRQQIEEWITTLTSAEARFLSTVCPEVLLPDGRRFRGFPIVQDCWFGRDRRFWGLVTGSDTVQVIPLEDVIVRCTMQEILDAYRKAKVQAKERSPRLYQYFYGD